MNRMSSSYSGHMVQAIALLTFTGLHSAFASLHLSGVQQIASGNGTTCATVNGAVECWGSNSDGQLGNGTLPLNTTTPALVTGLAPGATVVATGGTRTCAIVGGGVYCWGDYYHAGFLGNGTSYGSLLPTLVVAQNSGASALAVAQYHACFVITGEARCWGNNISGELGNGTYDEKLAPVAVTGLSSGVTAIAAGDSHTCAIVNGGVQCWGDNSVGQLGNGDGGFNKESALPVAVSGLSMGVSSLSAGGDHTCVVVNGSAKCWGANYTGELGIDQSYEYADTPVDVYGLNNGITAVAAGESHSCALGASGMSCWGLNGDGELGNASSSSTFAPVQVSIANVKSISAGSNYTCASVAAADNTIQMECWGTNHAGELGVGGKLLSAVPVAAQGLNAGVSVIGTGSGAYADCAIVSGAAQCWGDDAFGQLGSVFNGVDRAVAVQVDGLGSGVTSIATGSDQTCAVVNGSVECWGESGYGELGEGSTQYSQLPQMVSGLSSGATAVAAGDHHSCAIVNGGAQCWGDDTNGQLGNGVNTTQSSVPISVTGLSSGVSMIAAGAAHTCAVASGAAWCWGENGIGQLGDGTATERDVPTPVSGLGSAVVAIATGRAHTCAVVGGAAKCWGHDGFGQLGDGTHTTTATPVTVSGLSAGVTAITTGYDFSCALVNGGVMCWGRNEYGELGDGVEELQRNSPVAVVGLDSGVVAIAAGYRHVCALLSGGATRCWGDDTFGQLADGRFVTAENPQFVVLGDAIFRDGFEQN